MRSEEEDEPSWINYANSTPPRVAIKVLCIFPQELIKEISPDAESLRKTVKLPLLFLLLCTGLIGGFATVLSKCVGELIVVNDN